MMYREERLNAHVPTNCQRTNWAEEQEWMRMMNVLKLESCCTIPLSRSSPPRNFSRRLLDTVVWSDKEQISGPLVNVWYVCMGWEMLFCCITCTMAAMSMGSMARGNRRMLKSEMEVKAFSAVSTFSELTPTNTANVARETCEKRQHEGKKCKDYP